MYSEIVNDSNVSQHTMEILVLGGIGIFVLGLVFYLWWKQIMIGSLALVTLVVLANHKSPPSAEKMAPTPVIPKVEQEQIIIEKPVIQQNPVHIDLNEPPVELTVKPEDDKKAFMEDCLQFTDYTKSKCESIWNKKEPDESKI
jgi:hypothetical protein